METLLKLNDDLMGAPVGILVAIFAIAVGFLLKSLPFVNNKYIPLTVVLFCTVAFMLVAPPRDPAMPQRIYVVKNLMFGFIIGFVAWAFHRWVLKALIGKYLPKDTEDNQQPPKQP